MSDHTDRNLAGHAGPDDPENARDDGARSTVYGIARRIEQTSGHQLHVHYGTLYASLLKLEQEGAIVADWGSLIDAARKFYKLTRAGRARVVKASREWQQATAIIERFFAPRSTS